MKTLDEALLSASSLLSDEHEAENALRLRNAEDIAKDIMSSPLVVEFVTGMLTICMDRYIEDEMAQSPLDLMRSLAFTAFVAGVRVGMEMGSTREGLPKVP